MFTTDLVNLYNISKTSLYIYIFQDEKCHLMHNLSLSMDGTSNEPSTEIHVNLLDRLEIVQKRR